MILLWKRKEMFFSGFSIISQIAYKLFLGSYKDIEDARHLYKLFKDKLNKEEWLSACMKLSVMEKRGLLE